MKLSLSNVNLLTLAALTALPFVSANAQYYPGQGEKKIVHRVNRQMAHNTRIDLQRALANKLRAGEKIKSIRIVGQSSAHNSKVILKSYGQTIGQVSLDYYGGPKLIPVPLHVAPSSLKLVVKGGAYLQRIVAGVVKDWGSGPMPGQGQVVKALLDQHTYSTTIIPVRQVIKQQTGVQLRGLKAKKIILKAKAKGHYSNTTAQVLINGSPVGMPIYLSTQMERRSIQLPAYQRNIIGDDIKSIKIKVQGQALVKMVGIKVKDMYSGGGYGNGQSSSTMGSGQVVVHTQQALYGRQTISLAQLVGHDYTVDMQRPIKKIVLTVQGSGTIKLSSAGYSNTVAQRANRNGKIVFNINNSMASVRSLALITRGNLTLEKVKIVYSY
ncbi:MAG: hypothetical protein N4A33_02145 [Bacteriovoracaceae bacterium]|nr:hypothetical protein [Bacteriovoracaceae bacterium]